MRINLIEAKLLQLQIKFKNDRFMLSGLTRFLNLLL